MKVHQIICPKCQASLTSKSGIEDGTSISCPKCKNKFAVAAPNDDDEIIEDFEVVDDDEEEEPPRKAPSKPALKPLSKQRKQIEEDEDDEEEEPPRKAAAKPALKPLSKQRKQIEEDDDEEEEPPRKAPSKPALKPLSKQRKQIEEDDDEEEETPRKPAAKPTLTPVSKKRSDDDDDDDRPKKASGAFDNLNDDDERPARKKKRRDDDDEEEDKSPRARRRGRHEDDEDEDEVRPRRRGRGEDEDDEGDDKPRSGYAKLKSNIYVRASVLGVLLAILGVLAYLLYDKYKKKDDSGSAQNENDPSKPIIVDTRQPSGKKPPDNPLPANNNPAEQAKFQGSWEAVSVFAGGVNAPPDELAKMTFTVTGDQAVTPDDKDPATIRLDATKNPAQIDLIEKSNKVARGIYRFLNPDTLEICLNFDGKGPRPTSFASPKGSSNLLLRMARSK